MILGITLSHFACLQSKGEQAKASKRTLRLLSKTSEKKFRTHKIEDLTFENFIDLENYLSDQNFNDFCRIFVRKKFWQTVYVHNLPLIMQDFADQKKELFENYYWIFDPPQYGEPEKETPGTEVRKEFVEEFGSWVVLMDKVCRGHLVDYKQVEQWKFGEFLFWANYLSGQRIVENLK